MTIDQILFNLNSPVQECSKCHQKKPLSAFWKNQRFCKDCKKVEAEKYRNQKREQINTYKRQWAKKRKTFNPERDPVFIHLGVIQPAEFSIHGTIPQINAHLNLGFCCDPCDETIDSFVSPTKRELDKKGVKNYIIFFDEDAFIMLNGRGFFARNKRLVEIAEAVPNPSYRIPLPNEKMSSQLRVELLKRDKFKYEPRWLVNEKWNLKDSAESWIIFKWEFHNSKYELSDGNVGGTLLKDEEMIKKVRSFIQQGLDSDNMIYFA